MAARASVKGIVRLVQLGFVSLPIVGLTFSAQGPLAGPGLRFVDISREAGVEALHANRSRIAPDRLERVAGGVAAADFDRDGFVDLYVETGAFGPNRLFRNLGDGTFGDVAAVAGVALDGHVGSGPLFFDYDGDGWPDLFVGGVEARGSKLFHNDRTGGFEDVTEHSGLEHLGPTVSASAGDVDADGFIDLFLSHWGAAPDCNLLRNQNGTGRFTCADGDANLGAFSPRTLDLTFATNLSDIDGDGDLDLLSAGDFGTSSVWRNSGRGRFEPVDVRLTDENGMGSAVGDYDADGDLDWFVSSIYDGDGISEGDWGRTGNRLYQNDGSGHFVDETDSTGVREGGWGWAAAFADFDNDGWLDLVHVNGWDRAAQFRGTTSRLFIGQPTGAFVERGADLGLMDQGSGRGLVVFDFDRDGDLDLFVANNDGPSRLWRNDGGDRSGHYLAVRIESEAPNPSGVGARIEVRAGGRTQVRELRAGSNYASQNPLEAHFGLGPIDRVDRLRVVLPDGRELAREDLPVDQLVIVRSEDPRSPASPGCSAPR